MLPFPLPEPTEDAAPDGLPVAQVLYGLFFHPRVLLWLQRDRLRRAFRFASVVCLLVGLAVGIARVPSILAATREWAGWLENEVEELSLTDGELQWKRPRDLPYTTRHDGWRIDFAEKGVPFAATEIDGPERRGLWLSPDRVILWVRPADRESAIPVPLLDEGRTRRVVKALYPDGLTLRRGEFRAEARRRVFHLIPVFLVQQALWVFVQVMFYILVFAAMPVLMQRLSGGAAGFRRLFTFYLYASVPPLCAAGIYASLRLPYLDLGTAFVMAFVVYLGMVFVNLRDMLDAPEKISR